MHIYLGYDHNGFALRESIIAHLKKRGLEVTDMGNQEYTPGDDYPEFAEKVAIQVQRNSDSNGILVCGSGIGICIAANKFKDIRAALVTNGNQAFYAKNDDDANVLCLAERMNTLQEILGFIDIFVKTPFEGGRHERRKEKILGFEQANFK